MLLIACRQFAKFGKVKKKHNSKGWQLLTQGCKPYTKLHSEIFTWFPLHIGS